MPSGSAEATSPSSAGEVALLLPSPAQQRIAAHIVSCAGLAPRDINPSTPLASISEVNTRLALMPASVYAVCFAQCPARTPIFIWNDCGGHDHFELLQKAKGPRGFFEHIESQGIRPWELLAVARRCSRPQIPSPSHLLNWGHSWAETVLTGTEDRHRVLQLIQDFSAIWLNRKTALTTAELADELIMNAIYDAPVDRKTGIQKYAHNRKNNISLAPDECPVFGFGSDGTRIVLSIADPFGALNATHVFAGIHRGITSGEMDVRGGGAGLGMLVIHRGAEAVFFDVRHGAQTQVTAVINLDNRRRRQSFGSVHFFSL